MTSTVSDEDREELLAVIFQAQQDTAALQTQDIPDDVYWVNIAGAVSEALVSHGWGPRPTVSRAHIDEYMRVAVLAGASASSAVRGFMRECGIEVTSD